ncbi:MULTISPECIES: hypothetical protein [unclassified Sphingomonas]|jgi:hypothetical protein|uniref:hypothetical protein n=1 Tax=unclassified Sphingomonas TaxID=196159 RepID=UPI0025CBAADD|nr:MULTISPECIES: hypothetical protein [unclassified Sphingomonas]
MLRTRRKRQTAEAERAVVRLAEIRASVAALADDDLLDLADIFAGDTPTPLGAIAAAEMAKRNISL